MANQKDIWKLYDEYRIHSDKKRKVNKIVKEANGKVVCEYFKKGKVFAWDVEFSESKLDIVRKILKEK